MNGMVLQVFDPVTGGVQNTGIKAEMIRANGSQLVVGIREPTSNAATASKSAAPRPLAAHQYDTNTGRLTNLRTGFDAVPPRVLASDASMSPTPSGRERPIGQPTNASALIAPIESPAAQAPPAPTGAASTTAHTPSGPPKPGVPPAGDAESSTSSASESSTRSGDGAYAAAGGD